MIYEDGVERRDNEVGWSNLVCIFLVMCCIGFINFHLRDAVNRASVVPSCTSSPTRSVGTIPSQCSSGSTSSSGSGGQHGSRSTVFIPADGDVPDIGSTISSLTRSSFQSVPMESPYQLDFFHSARRPRSIDDNSLPLPGQEFLEFMSSSDTHIAIAPSKRSSLRRTSSMTDLDEYASAAPPVSETSESPSAFDMPLLPSCGLSSAGSRSQAVPRTIHSGSSVSSASSPNWPLPDLLLTLSSRSCVPTGIQKSCQHTVSSCGPTSNTCFLWV
jgi:hypothetical protein